MGTSIAWIALPADETGDDRAELRGLLAGASPGTDR